MSHEYGHIVLAKRRIKSKKRSPKVGRSQLVYKNSMQVIHAKDRSGKKGENSKKSFFPPQKDMILQSYRPPMEVSDSIVASPSGLSSAQKS